MSKDPKQVQKVFLAVLESTEIAERDAILDRECGSDVELRRRVNALLKAHDAPEERRLRCSKICSQLSLWTKRFRA